MGQTVCPICAETFVSIGGYLYMDKVICRTCDILINTMLEYKRSAIIEIISMLDKQKAWEA